MRRCEYSLIRVVHVVVNGIKTCLVRARITADGATTRSAELSWGICDFVTCAGAVAALEGVQETLWRLLAISL
jgi:hypothetical protein